LEQKKGRKTGGFAEYIMGFVLGFWIAILSVLVTQVVENPAATAVQGMLVAIPVVASVAVAVILGWRMRGETNSP
jgi:hypothetical protein